MPKLGEVQFAFEMALSEGVEQWFYYRHGMAEQSDYFPSEEAARQAYARSQQ